MKFEIKKKILKPLCIYSLAFSMLLPSVASLADLDINLGGYSVVYAETVPAPTVTKAFIGTNTISGGNVHVDRVSGKVTRGTVHVTLKDKDSVVKADNLTFTPKSGKNWTVNLPDGVTIAEGDVVTVYQEFDGQNSPVTTANAMESLAKQNKDKLQMPTGEIYIEQTSSNQVNEDEQAEAVQKLKDANTAIAGDIKSVKFSIDGTEHAYYEITYTDGSTSGKVEATNLKIKQVTEYSRGATLGSITIVDNVIKGKLSGEGPFDGIKVQILLKLSDAVKGSYCDGGKCLTDKDTSDPVDATVDGTTGEFSYTIPNPDLKLDQVVGVTVKEKNKFKSCSKTTVKPVVVGKTEVKDPRKLTGEDKKAIDAAIRKAYTVNGESKLPNGSELEGGVPAVIQFDDSGNVKIFSGGDVKGNWDDNYKFVPEKNADGSYKLNDGAEPKITIPAKDLLKNIKPEAPAVALSKDKKNITITPNKVDTDAMKITVNYEDPKGNKKEAVAVKKVDNSGTEPKTTWEVEKGDITVGENGVITLPKDKVKGGTDVTATVTDKGGIADDDKDPLISDPGTLTVEETIADKVEALGGLDPVDIKKWVKDTVDWKEGVKAKDSTKETEVNKLLAGATFTDVTETNRSTSKEGDFEGKIKITFDDKSELVVEKQMLYVSNHVTSVERKDKVPTDALDVEFKLGEGTKVDNTDGSSITGPNSYQKYKVKPNTNLKEYKIPVINTSVIDSIKVTPQEGYTEPVWRDSKNGTDFVATADNNVFTATATKTFKVTVQANGGTGEDKVETKKSGEKYTLPKGETFTPPANQKFAGWLVGDATTTTEPGTEITITSDTVIKASWKPIMVDVIFDKGKGSGEKDKVSVAKGSEYTLPNSEGFTPPANQEFAGWEVNGKAKNVGDTITVNENTTVTAKYKPIMVDVIFDKGEGSGEKAKATVAKGSEYTLPNSEGFTPPANQEFAGWEVNGKAKNVGDTITVNENTTVTAKYKPIMVDVIFDKGEGSGSKEKASVAKGSEYTLPDGKEFTPPENQVFAGWKVGNEEKAVGDKITVNENTTVTAKYKDSMVEVNFAGNGGVGSMDKASLKKGSTYKLPDNKFTAPENKEFDGWVVNGEDKKVGDEITVTDNTTVTAKWKDKTTTPEPGTEPGTDPGTKPGTDPSKPGDGTNPDNQNPNNPKVEVDPETGETKVTPDPNTDKVVIPTTDKDGKNPETVVVEKDEEGKWKGNDPSVTVDPDTGKTTIPADRKVDKDHIISESKPKVKPEEPSYEEYEIPEIKIRDHYTPTFPVYVTVPKTEKVEKAEEVPVSLETHKAYIAGYEDNTLRAEGNITRAEAAAMVTRLAGLDLSDTSMPAFKDMQKNAWYFRYINAAVKAKMLDADNGMMRPNDKITRAEFAKMLAAIDKENSSVSKFDDIKGHRYEKEINKIYGNNRIEGYEDGSFRPDAYLTRAESAAFLNRMFNRIADKEAYAGLEDKLAKFKDFDASKWYYDEMVEATNSHELTRRGKASDKYGRVYEKWTRILPSDVK